MPASQIFWDFCGSALKNATEACATGEAMMIFLPWGTNFLPFPRMTVHIVKCDRGGGAAGSTLSNLGWVVDAIEHGLDVKFTAVLRTNLHIVAQPATMSTRAATGNHRVIA